MSSRRRVGVLASGSGTNLQAILDTVHGRDGIEVVAVASDKPDAYALERARAAGVPAAVFPIAPSADDRTARDQRIAAWLHERGAGLVVLAGYMQLLAPEFLRKFPDAVINVHPALLPAFPGLHAQRQALEHGVKVSGATVHLVDDGLDSGPILLQEAVPVREDDDAERLAARILEVEHRLYPRALRLVAEGRYCLEGRRARILEEQA